MTPQLGDLIELEVEAVGLLAGWSGLGIDDHATRVGTDLAATGMLKPSARPPSRQ